MMNEFLPVRVHCVDLDGIEQLRHAVNAKGGETLFLNPNSVQCFDKGEIPRNCI